MDINKLKEKMSNVPFGNSQFQIKNFIANEYTPERAYRKVLLQLDKKMKTMQECSFRRRRHEIDIAEIKEKLKTAENFEAERLKIDLEEKEYYLNEEIKLIEDCAIEIKTYEAILKELPETTRENFERSEFEYWKQRLISDANCEFKANGFIQANTLDSLNKIGFDMIKKDGKTIIIEKEKIEEIEFN